jgi:hypothetical protein
MSVNYDSPETVLDIAGGHILITGADDEARGCYTTEIIPPLSDEAGSRLLAQAGAILIEADGQDGIREVTFTNRYAVDFAAPFAGQTLVEGLSQQMHNVLEENQLAPAA